MAAARNGQGVLLADALAVVGGVADADPLADGEADPDGWCFLFGVVGDGDGAGENVL